MISAAARAALRYVQISDPAVDLARFPDFLIVGPQRTGTTWLHAHLRYHPEIMLAEPKELYFFSSLTNAVNPRFRSRELRDYLRYFREPWWRVAVHHFVSLRQFRALYRPRVRGEATASYAALDREVIRDITTLKPDIKAILMIRNPVERAWSHAKKDLARNRGRKLEDVSADEIERFFSDPYQRQCARYVENIDNWAACLQPGHLLVALFDDIDRRPEALLLEVMAFLGVSSDRRYVSDEVRTPVNPTGPSKIPERYRRFLENLLRDDLAQLEQRFGLSWSSPQAGGQLVRRAGHARETQRFILALEEEPL